MHNPHPPVQVLQVLSEDQIETIHQASLRVLRDIGMKVLSPDEALREYVTKRKRAIEAGEVALEQ